jgi:hypothetical protein
MPATSVATFVWTQGPNAIKNVSTNLIQLVPNPGTDFVELKLSDAENLYRTVEFYSLNGSLVLKQAIPGLDTRIDISNLSKGIYFVKVSTRNNQYFNRFIRQ